MSYEKKDFYLDDREPIVGSGNTFKYHTTDSTATVEASGYFTFSQDGDDVGSETKVGDFIKVKASDGSRMYSVATLNPTTIEGSSIAPPSSLDGDDVANSTVANDGAIPIVFSRELPGGATADLSELMNNKIRVISVDILSKGSGIAGDTFVLRNGSDNITDVVDLTTATDGKIFSITTINTTHRDLDVGDGLSFYEFAQSGTAPALSVTVTAVRIA